MSLVREYNESVEGSLVYTSTEYITNEFHRYVIQINLTMINTYIGRIMYVMDEDELYIRNNITRKVSVIQNFSTINSEEMYFQQMTVQDCSDFEYTDVLDFMNNMYRIYKNRQQD